MARKLSVCFPDSEAQKLNQYIAEIEKTGNIQIVLGVVNRSDSYVEIPWKAFAAGSAITGFLVFILHLLLSDLDSVLILTGLPIFIGAIFMLMSLIHPFARFFLSSHRADLEVKQYAQSLFLSKELFATEKRTGFLMFISIFERRVFLLPDKGLLKHFSEKQLEEIIKPMIVQLHNKNLYAAFETGLNKLGSMMNANRTTNMAMAGKNELPDDIIREGSI